MIRVEHDPRPDWQHLVEEKGLMFHTGVTPYWNEQAHYEFTAAEVDELEAATDALHTLCVAAAEHVIANKRYAELKLPETIIPLIEQSWNDDYPSVYGRFDLVYDGVHAPKMLEYNADTPTSLLEASVVQWYWLQDVVPGADQWNSIHERLIAAWRSKRPFIPLNRLHLTAHFEELEDQITVTYMADVAAQAGIDVTTLDISQVGWDQLNFKDEQDRDINALFKLYPWEDLMHDTFAKYVGVGRCTMIEPAWKLILSNKGILPILWELNPGHPNLLEAYAEDNGLLDAYAKKPFFSREGANIELKMFDQDFGSTDGLYGAEGFVYQALAPLPDFNGHHPVIGAWVIDGYAAGMGIREANTLITNNTSRFVPHLFR